MPFPLKNIACAGIMLLFVLVVISSAQHKRPSKNKSTVATKNIIAKRDSSKERKANGGAKQRSLEARRRAEELRRKLIEERRRREELIRQARARQMAFERGLFESTIDNIKNDQTEGEDLEIRRAAIDALGNHAGTIVVMETQTGRVLTIVNQDWGVRHSFKPCSTIKLVTAIAGLNEGIIQRSGEIAYQPFRLDLTDALAFSNNTFFQKVGVRLGLEKFVSYAKMLGLGEKTGINLPDESPGKLPYSEHNPRVYSHGDAVEVTAIQLAVMVSAITNNGKIIVPQIPRFESQKASFREIFKREISLPSYTFQGVLPGMIGAVNYGTAKTSGVSYLNVAGKTGSCIGQGSWLGLFASVAPVVNPQYTVVVITRGHRERGKVAATIAGKVYQALEKRLKQIRNYYLAKDNSQQISVPKPKVDERISILIDGGDNEEIDDIISTKNSRKKISQTVDDLIQDRGQVVDGGKASTDKKMANERKSTNDKKNEIIEKGSQDKPQNGIFKPIIIEPKKKQDTSEEQKPKVLTRPRIVKTVTNTRIL